MTSVHSHAIRVARSAAARAHRGQFRKTSGAPYIVHPERVAARVKFFGGSHTGIVAAWLHDVMEDCGGGERIVQDTLRESGLPREDRDRILAMVAALTKDAAIKGKQAKLDDSLRRINTAPTEAVLIKLCDRMDNLADGRERGAEFLRRYLPETDRLIDALAPRAIAGGYRNALETLRAQRRVLGEEMLRSGRTAETVKPRTAWRNPAGDRRRCI